MRWMHRPGATESQGERAGVVKSRITLMGRKIETPGFKEGNKGDDGKREAHGCTVPPHSSGRRQSLLGLVHFST